MAQASRHRPTEPKRAWGYSLALHAVLLFLLLGGISLRSQHGSGAKAPTQPIAAQVLDGEAIAAEQRRLEQASRARRERDEKRQRDLKAEEEKLKNLAETRVAEEQRARQAVEERRNEERAAAEARKQREAEQRAADTAREKAEAQRKLAERADQQAREQQAKAAEEAKRKAAEKTAAAKAVAEKAAAAKATADKAAAEKAAADRAAAAKRQAAADAAKAAAAEAAREKAAADAKRAAEAAAAAASAAQADEIGRYVDAIKRAVSQRWNRPPSWPAGSTCEVRVKMIPSGEVITVVSNCADPAHARSVEDAVLRASPLPVPTDLVLFNAKFRNLTFVFTDAAR